MESMREREYQGPSQWGRGAGLVRLVEDSVGLINLISLGWMGEVTGKGKAPQLEGIPCHSIGPGNVSFHQVPRMVVPQAVATVSKDFAALCDGLSSRYEPRKAFCRVRKNDGMEERPIVDWIRSDRIDIVRWCWSRGPLVGR